MALGSEGFQDYAGHFWGFLERVPTCEPARGWRKPCGRKVITPKPSAIIGKCWV